MGLQAKIERSVGKLQILPPANQRELQCWLIDELTVLAEAVGDSVTAARLRIYAEDLSDLSRAQLETAFIRARRECKFFPKLPELRDMAGAGAQQVKDAEAEEAWNFVIVYLRKWGVDRMPIYSGGKKLEPPILPARIDYSLRAIGGFWSLNQMTTDSRPWLKRDFVEAYNRAPVAESLPTDPGRWLDAGDLTARLKRLAVDKQIDDRPIGSRRVAIEERHTG